VRRGAAEAAPLFALVRDGLGGCGIQRVCGVACAEEDDRDCGSEEDDVADASGEAGSDDGACDKGVQAVGERSPGGEREGVERSPVDAARKEADEEQEDDVNGENGGEGAPVPGGRREHHAESEKESDGAGDPWRRNGPGGGAWAARGNEKRGDDERDAAEASAEELLWRGDEAIAPEGDAGADEAADEEEQSDDRVAETSEPGLFSAGGEERFNKGDGNGDAPEGMEVEHEEGPPGADVEGGNPGMVEKMHVHLQVVGIEEGLGGEAFFDERVGGAEEEDAGPTAASAADDLADEESPAAVHGREGDQRDEQLNGQVAQEVFGDQRRGEDERDGGGDASLGASHGNRLWSGSSVHPHAGFPAADAGSGRVLG
jgi:hypothetical protein